ncbi:MAG: hypothetical protein K8E66_09695 [Phycisphaerales bacterium]|nr:hypothetical protein [Phycisphaerales bacterium]
MKLLLGSLCASAVPVSLVVDWGPSHDMKQAWTLREKMRSALWGDREFDSGAWHAANWREWGVPSDAPTAVHNADGASERERCRCEEVTDGVSPSSPKISSGRPPPARLRRPTSPVGDGGGE